MTRTDLLVACAAIFLFFAIMAGATHKARGQSLHHAEHALHHDVYKLWMRPHMPSVPCCGAKYDENGKLISGGDCYATAAEIRPSAERDGPAWWARRDDGKWIEIPRDRVINEANPDGTGTRAHLCEHHENFGSQEIQLIHCFLPPVSSL